MPDVLMPDDAIFEVSIRGGQAEVREATRFWIVNALKDGVETCGRKRSG